MGFRFRKRIKIAPGAWLNLSKSGVSTSIGGKGLTVNLKDGKTTTTASLPGTGLSYRSTTKASTTEDNESGIGVFGWLLALIVLVVAYLLTR